MKALKWGKFYWSDWESDHNLKLCSLAAQGLWMRCLCICAKADAPGYLILGGKALDPKSVAKVSGVSIKIATKLLAELEDNNVFSRNKDGVVYSRRMVRDGRKSGQAREHGKLGGNPLLGGGGVNPPHKPGDNPGVNPPLKPGLNPRVKARDNPPLKPRVKAEVKASRVRDQRLDNKLTTSVPSSARATEGSLAPKGASPSLPRSSNSEQEISQGSKEPVESAFEISMRRNGRDPKSGERLVA